MTKQRRHAEKHRVGRVGWLRAAVLGANDGLLSTGSLIIGVAAASANRHSLLLTGLAGLVAGAMSMAAGEYVSVSSQADAEAADLARERQELADDPKAEHRELTGLYVKRGVEADVAEVVAEQLMAKDALAAHAHDELGISEATAAQPVQAALASAASFSVGAAMPLAMAFVAPPRFTVEIVAAASILFLAALGAIGARAGGANVPKATLRVTFWGAAAMAVTAGVGALFGTTVS
jgi:VIT1/CCC1 family predicted Fe2+/Mn2+ transporter